LDVDVVDVVGPEVGPDSDAQPDADAGIGTGTGVDAIGGAWTGDAPRCSAR
jgi:hypothetical protein